MGANRKASSFTPKAAGGLPVTAILIAFILLLALFVRMLPVIYDLGGGNVLFSGLDSYYHMRRITYTVYHFPSVNIFDSYVNFPAGFPIYWPPLYDQISAGLSLLAGLGHPGSSTIELTSALVPALIGVLSIIPLYFIVKDTMGRHAAMIAALIMAIVPGSVYQSLFGATDHHGLEVLLSLTMYLFFMRAVSSARGTKPENAIKQKKTLAYAALAGVAMAAMIFTWDGAPIFIGIVVAYSLVQYTYDAYRKERSAYLTIAGSIASLVALAVVAPVAATGDGGAQVSALVVSWFHILYLLAILLFFLVVGGMSEVSARRGLPWYALPASAIGLACLLMASIRVVAPNFFSGIGEGIIFLVAGNSVLSTVQEMQPLFIESGRFSLLVPWSFLSTAMILSLFGLLVYLLSLRGRMPGHADLFMIVWTAFAIALGLLQQRFIYVLAVNVSVFAGYALYLALDAAGLDRRLAGQSPDTRGKRQKSKAASATPALTVVAIFSLLLLAPLFIGSVSLALTPEYYASDWNEACTWVNGHTPATSFTYSADNGTHPEYGIMSWWDYGNYILYRAGRPAVANNFQTGIESSSRFFIALNETAADAIMDNRSARYVMADDRMGSPYAGVRYGIFESMPYLAGDDPNSYHMRINASAVTVSPKYYDTMYARLFDFDGCGYKSGSGNVTGGLSHYRLIFATSGDDPVKVFEYVKGADIAGTAAPGSDVEISLDLSLPDGERIYYGTATTGSDGSYRLTVPYGGTYVIRSGGTVSHAEVPENAVESGSTVSAA